MKEFRFEGFQQDAFGGAFPLFTEVIKVYHSGGEVGSPWESNEFGTTLSGRAIFEMGYIVPSFPQLQDTEKGDILELKQRKTFNIPSQDKILDS